MCLKPSNNPSHALRLIHEMKYYSDLFTPSPKPVPETFTPIVPDNADSVTTSWFLARLIHDWDLWAPFEASLLHLPETNQKKAKWNTTRGLSILSTNVKSFGYAICSVMPWRKYPQNPPVGDHFRTWAGMVVSRHHAVLLSHWLIDKMFAEDVRTMRALEAILKVDEPRKGTGFQNKYQSYWAANVLCGAIFKWSEMAGGSIDERELEKLWDESREYWKSVSLAVDRVRWGSSERPSQWSVQPMSEPEPTPAVIPSNTP